MSKKRLSAQEKKEILYMKGEYKAEELSEMYGCSLNTVYNIWRNTEEKRRSYERDSAYYWFNYDKLIMNKYE